METNYTPLYPVKETNLKNKIEILSQIALSKGNADLSSKIGTIKGLYSAYEISPSIQLMEAIAIALAEIVEALLLSSIPFIPVIKEREEMDIFELFRRYLIENGFSKPDGTPTTTVDVYVRAVKRIFKNGGNITNNKLKELINDLIQIILAPNLDVSNENVLNRVADLLGEIIEIKTYDENEVEKNKRDHGTTLCALKRFLMFILWLLSQCVQKQ